MNAEIKALWVAVLRSDEYGANNDGCMCIRLDTIDDTILPEYDPLGVLCELAIKAGIALFKDERESRREMGFIEVCYNAQYLELPQKVVEWAGLDSSNPILDWTTAKGRADIATIHFYNQTGDFTEIAKLIEKQL